MTDELPVIASVSGGKDSAALCLWLQEQCIPYRAIHMDTGWEHPATDEYLRGELERKIGPIEWITHERTMVELIRHKSMFPARVLRFCTEQLKMVPLLDWLMREYQVPVINAIGIRADESSARGKLGYCEAHEWGYTWRPLLRWKMDDVVAIHDRHDLRPNPLYMLGASRVGCWPCIFARKEEKRLVARLTPERIDLIRKLEVEIGEAMAARHPGEVLRWTPTFFTLRDPGSTKHRSATIDEVMEWAMGKQVEMFDDDERAGCMRWGLCDA